MGILITAQAQPKGQRFGSQQCNAAIETWKYISDNNAKDLQDWAKAVYNEFGLNQKDQIEHKYVVTALDTLNLDRVMMLTKMWIQKAFAVPADSILVYDASKRIIKANVTLLGMGDTYGVGIIAAASSEAHVNIPLQLTFQFKENRLRYIARISNFVLNSSDWFKDEVNKTMPLTDCYPVKENSKHKDSFSRAYINGNAKCLTSCRDYIQYLNAHLAEKQPPKPKTAEEDDDDW